MTHNSIVFLSKKIENHLISGLSRNIREKNGDFTDSPSIQHSNISDNKQQEAKNLKTVGPVSSNLQAIIDRLAGKHSPVPMENPCTTEIVKKTVRCFSASIKIENENPQSDYETERTLNPPNNESHSFYTNRTLLNIDDRMFKFSDLFKIFNNNK